MKKIIRMEDCFVFSRPVSEDEILHLARVITTTRFIRTEPQMTSSQLAGDFLSPLIGSKEREIFMVVFLDIRHRIIAYEELFRGTINCIAIYPREIVKRVLFHNAAGVILAHNHPSGDPTPSSNDLRVTTCIKDALALIETKVLDHLILAGSKWFSFADGGIL